MIIIKSLVDGFFHSKVMNNVILIIDRILRKIISFFYKWQFRVQWGAATTPEWFDHYIDLYGLWGHEKGNCFWLERGAFSMLALKDKGNVLELCCGDGFNSKYFYSYKAAKICSCDFDPVAIRHAKRNNQTKKNDFVLADIRDSMPEGIFDNIVWDAAIEHFTPTEIRMIMENIKHRLGVTGILSGYTIVERAEGKQLEQHEYEFKSKEDLMRFLSPWFTHVKIFETIYSERHNLYFYASDGVLPLTKDWKFMIDKSS